MCSVISNFFPLSLFSNGYFSLFFLLSRSLVFLKIVTLLSLCQIPFHFLQFAVSFQWSILCSQETVSCEIPMPPTSLLRRALAPESREDPLGSPSPPRRMLRLQIRTPCFQIPNPRRPSWRARSLPALRLPIHSSGSSVWRHLLRIRSLGCLILVWRYISCCNYVCYGST